MKKIVFLTGAGMSAESNISTFRSGDKPLWENEEFIRDYASVYGWNENTENFLNFYNEMFEALKDVQPNNAHIAINEIAKTNFVTIYTQNVDDLHEKAKNPNINHLHGKLWEMKTDYSNTVYPYKKIEIGDCDDQGFQLRPNVVLFGENIHNLDNFLNDVSQADYLICVGTSFVVYPLEMLVSLVGENTQIFNINTEQVFVDGVMNITQIASVGLNKLIEILLPEDGVIIGGTYIKNATQKEYTINSYKKIKIQNNWVLGVEYANEAESFVIELSEFNKYFTWKK